MKKLYVGNLPFSATESQVRELFEKHGEVNSVALIMDRETGRPRGFGFVEISDSGMAAVVRSASTRHRTSRVRAAAAAVAAATAAAGNLV